MWKLQTMLSETYIYIPKSRWLICFIYGNNHTTNKLNTLVKNISPSWQSRGHCRQVTQATYYLIYLELMLSTHPFIHCIYLGSASTYGPGGNVYFVSCVILRAAQGLGYYATSCATITIVSLLYPKNVVGVVVRVL